MPTPTRNCSNSGRGKRTKKTRPKTGEKFPSNFSPKNFSARKPRQVLGFFRAPSGKVPSTTFCRRNEVKLETVNERANDANASGMDRTTWDIACPVSQECNRTLKNQGVPHA